MKPAGDERVRWEETRVWLMRRVRERDAGGGGGGVGEKGERGVVREREREKIKGRRGGGEVMER